VGERKGKPEGTKSRGQQERKKTTGAEGRVPAGAGARANNILLTAEELAQIDAILPAGAAAGERYHAQAMQTIDR
jgi:hypothetical protein